MRENALCAGVEQFPVGEHLVLAGPHGSRLYLLNESARHVWEDYRAGRTREDIAARMCRRYHVDPATAQRDVDATLGFWRHSVLQASPPAAGAAPERRWEALLRTTAADPHRGDYLVNGRTVRLVIRDRGIAGDLAPRLEPLRNDQPPLAPQVEIDLYVEDGEALVFRNRQLLAAETLAAGRFTVLEQMIRAGWPDTPWSAFLHAGAAALGASGVVFAAGTGAGKSTLAAALAHAGFELLTDDMTALHAPSGTLAAAPLAVQIRSGSWAALRPRFPAIDDLPVVERGGQRLRFMPLATQQPSAGIRCAALVFTRFVAGSPLQWCPLSTWDALLQLDAGGFWIAAGTHSTRGFLQWLEATPKFELKYADLDAAVGFVRSRVQP